MGYIAHDIVIVTGWQPVITAAAYTHNEDETGGEGPYKAALHVITEASELNIAEAEGDAANGYYLHGFALGVTVERPADV